MTNRLRSIVMCCFAASYRATGRCGMMKRQERARSWPPRAQWVLSVIRPLLGVRITDTASIERSTYQPGSALPLLILALVPLKRLLTGRKESYMSNVFAEDSVYHDVVVARVDGLSASGQPSSWHLFAESCCVSDGPWHVNHEESRN